MFNWRHPFTAESPSYENPIAKSVGRITADRDRVLISIDRKVLDGMPSGSDAELVTRMVQANEGAGDWGGIDYPEVDLTPGRSYIVGRLLEQLAAGSRSRQDSRPQRVVLGQEFFECPTRLPPSLERLVTCFERRVKASEEGAAAVKEALGQVPRN